MFIDFKEYVLVFRINIVGYIIVLYYKYFCVIFLYLYLILFVCVVCRGGRRIVGFVI